MKLLFILLVLFVVTLQRKNDVACQTVKCSAGFRCVKGRCVPQERRPLKNLCMRHELARSIRPVRCTRRNSICTGAKNVLTCGFTATGRKLDFTDDCSPCANPNINFYYKLPCVDAPLVCGQNQECINGKCFELFDQEEDRDRKICNLSSDCEPLVQLCVANKCVQKKELFCAFAKNKKSYE